MKSKKKILSILLAVLSIFILNIDDVYAAQKVKISFDYQSNVYYTRKGDGLNDSHQYLYYNLSGTPAFCIEPGVEINDWDYLVYGIEKSPFDAEKTHRLQLIGHYGYDYPGHQTQRYRMATQKLIWETSKNLKVEFYTKINGGGTHIDISKEVNEILRLVDNHYTRPSFDGTTIDATYNNQIILDDANSILSDYEVYDDGGNTISINDNKLYITPKSMNNTSVILKKKLYDTANTIIYVGENGKSQKLGRFRATDPVLSSINLKTTGGTISISKQDSETNANSPQGNAKLSGAKYGVYDESDNLLTTITTDENGKGISETLNRLGKFYLKETTAPEGYLLDDNKYYFDITEDSLNKTIVVKDNVIKGNIKVTKYDSETNSCNAQGEATLIGAKYGIYNSSNTLVETLTIGTDCTATSKSLPYGKYSVKETVASNGYEKDNTTYNVNIVENNSLSNIISKESIIKAKIKVTKQDLENNSCKAQGDGTLIGAKYGVYDSNNTLIETLTIGNDCTATTKDLPYGKYSVKEISSSTGYFIDNKSYEANIINSNMVNIISKEEAIKGQIKITKYDSETNSCNAQGEATLIGAKFEIKDKNNNVVDTLIIGDDCTATSKNIPFGDYTIIEKESSKGYYINNNTFNTSVKENKVYNVTIKEEVIKNKFQFYKFYGNESTGFIYAEANARFNVFDKDGNVYTTFTTNTSGYAEVTLPYGKYSIEQETGLEDYKLMYPFEIEVNEKTSLTQTKHLKNGEITAKLRLIKIDSETKEQINIAGFKFKIKNINTNEYVCQTTDKVICEYSTNEEGILLTPLPLFGGDYEIEEIQAKPNYLLSNERMIFSIKNNTKLINDPIYGSLIELKFENQRVKGEIIIHKVGEKTNIVQNGFEYTDERLDGIKYCLYNDKKEEVKCDKTNKEGQLIFNNLELGKYYLKEVETLNDYVLDTKEYEIVLKYKDQKTPVITFETLLKNKLKKGTLEFTKTDFSESKTLPDTLIEIYTNDNKLIFTKRTDEKGKVVINEIPKGKYYILEKEAPEGYILNEEKMYFEIKENGEIVKATMKDEDIKGTLEFTKTDISESKALPNTLIEIYNSKTDEIVFSGRTNIDGKITINDLIYGKYYILEKEAPEGYILNEEKMYFEIKENGEIVKTAMKDEEITGTLEFTKTDFSESKTLPDTLIEIYTDKDELIFAKRTDQDGKVVIKKMKYGKYYILEKEAPEGYILNEEKMYFEIKENGEIVKATMKDEDIKGTLEFTKTDISDDTPLPNTLIEIYNAITNEIVFSGRTNEEGNIVITDLVYGRYYILEKEAPEGYELNDEKMYFEIKENGEIVKATMKDKKMIIDVPITLKNNYLPFIMFGISVIGLGAVAYGIKKNKKSKKK